MEKIICLFLLVIQIITGIDYQSIFGDDYQDALNYFGKNSNRIEMQLNRQQVDKELIVPIIFPERIRYSMIRDLIETTAVEFVYINYGPDYVDFSIGDFQIKPSFAEKVEVSLSKLPGLNTKYQSLINFRENGIQAKRKERVQRLKSFNYQLIYIAAFYDIINQQFNLSNKSKIEKIEFLASAYNYGFDKEMSVIESRIGVKYFPFGKQYRGEQYAYTSVAVDFYLNHYAGIFEIKKPVQNN